MLCLAAERRRDQDMVRVAALSEIGCIRANNEDSFEYDEAVGLYAVSDGMGGSAAGEVASRMAVETVLASFRRMRHSDASVAPQEALYYAVLQANSAVFQRAQQDTSCAGMGATLVALCLNGEDAVVANVGDSRAYLLRGGECTAMTQDHSLGAEQIRLGLAPASGRKGRNFDIVTRAIGMEAQVHPDLFTLRVLPGDRLLLATDGLMKHLPDASIAATVHGSATVAEACAALVDAVKRDGAQDNVTCLLVEV